MDYRSTLRAHAEFLERSMADIRADMACVGSEATPQDYVIMSKEYRLTVEQMRKMGIAEEERRERKSGLASMRVTVGRKAANA